MGKRSTAAATADRIREVARDAFGYERLRAGQERAIAEVLEGRDVLAVMPTGSGKSAIYQVAGLMVPGTTLVISPLLALQRDQIEALQRHDPEGGEARALNSTLGREEREEVLERTADEEVEFLFLAPEQFASGDTLERLAAAAPSLVVVDEAHCITEWGHDFRPEYLRLGSVIEALGRPRILALTATAAGPVRDDIVERLGMEDPVVIVRGFDRPNLHLEVERMASDEAKRTRLLERLPDLGTPGIVYVATRHHADELAGTLRDAGVRAAAYHAGLPKDERGVIQGAFMADELDVVVATVAFGMGIDKPDVRFVLHFDIPGSLDAYYQQVGRAGRDGEPATAVLLYRSEDVPLQRFLNSGASIDADTHERVAAAVAEAEEPLDVDDLRHDVDLSKSRLHTALNHLAAVGAVEVEADGTVRPGDADADPTEAALAAARVQERHRALVRSRVEMMKDYAESSTCRRAFVLSYFGEPFEPPCGRCDRCLADDAAAAVTAPDGPFPLGAKVVHERFGAGEVIRYETGKVVVLFSDVGYQSLALDLVLEDDLLNAAGP